MGNIKATFTPGVTALTVHGLHQWDYGRSLEISHPDLIGPVEVHFATALDPEAIVRVAPSVNGVSVAAIPDTLLEQTSPIMAWVYVLGATSGETMLTVTLQVTPRPRPAAAATMPEEYSDKYAMALAAVNAQVAALMEGNVTVAVALNAQEADEAHYADRAGDAKTAEKATSDGGGRNIQTTYRTKTGLGFQPSMYFQPVDGSLYLFRVTIHGRNFTAPILWMVNTEVEASLGCGVVDGVILQYALVKTAAGELRVDAFFHSDNRTREQTGWEYSFCQI